MGEANEVVAPRLGLPELPVVPWSETDDQTAPGPHWKTVVSLVTWAAGRSFVWLDDEITERDRRWSPRTIRYERCCIVLTLT